MSTLFLSSSGVRKPIIRHEFSQILPKDPTQLKVVYITTAVKMAHESSYSERDLEVLKDMGFHVVELDLEGKTLQQLRQLLEGVDIIYMQGGNGFYLLKHIRASGFDTLLPELLDAGVIYFGTSAGTYVVCPTIEMHQWKHRKRETHGVTDLTGMNLVPFLISVHYDETYRDIVKQGQAQTALPTKILTDDQALLVRGNNVTLVGKGPEVIL